MEAVTESNFVTVRLVILWNVMDDVFVSITETDALYTFRTFQGNGCKKRFKEMVAKKKTAENFSAHTKNVSSLIDKHSNVCKNLYSVPRNKS